MSTISPLLLDSSITRLIQIALNEDIGSGDITTETTIPDSTRARASFLCKADGIFCGLPILELVFRTLSDDVVIIPQVEEGASVTKGTVIAKLEGPAHALLLGERTALNFIQRMSGVATLAHKFVEAIKGTNATILDTRKTIPGWRLLDKYASQVGGAHNHRIGLFDMIMIKDNHIAASGGITQAIQRCNEIFTEGKTKIEVETSNLAQVQEVLNCGGVHRIMFDNFSVEDMKAAVQLVDGKYETEASGGINLQTVRSYAETGVQYISTGAITHSATALDISLDIALAVQM